MIREPIFQFLLFGLLIYIGLAELNKDAAKQNVIRIDDDTLARFYQFRTQSFTTDAATEIDQLSERALGDLIRQLVEEEALYRKALSFGMDRDDYVIRRRLVQKMEFLAEDEESLDRNVTIDEIKDYFDQHADSFEKPAVSTFTHVSLSRDKHGEALADRAIKMVSVLNKTQARFEDAAQFGDRFPYLLNYVEQSDTEIAGHFGVDMATRLGELLPDAKRWQGPLDSPFGAHIVMLTRREPAMIPPVEEVRDRIAGILVAARAQARKQEWVDKVIDDYVLEFSPDFERFSKHDSQTQP
ncbi:MAG: peptidyl-prolyl cis-trans isomerase C [Candidatus Azotimanducaceae bacterium]|jgi:peptidyl-prolyl cis-trans isomerase C